MRNIDDVLHFRQDIAPFLAHLTRGTPQNSAATVLEQIIRSRVLRSGGALVSDAKYGGNTNGMSDAEKQGYFSAVCFTETPISEIHCLLEIAARAVNLEPYGLVFEKQKLRAKGVAPVLYFNNENGAVDTCIQALFGLIATRPVDARYILPLVASFGLKIQPPGAAARSPGNVDFSWEREWRYGTVLGPFEIEVGDVFCGLCPHDEIPHFEALLPPVKFIDPRRPMKWYATELIACRQRLGLKASVV